MERMQEIVGSEDDPLQIAVDIARDLGNDTQTRLGACAVVLPYLYPRLSASTVQSTLLAAKIDPAELVERLADRLGKRSVPTIVQPEP